MCVLKGFYVSEIKTFNRISGPHKDYTDAKRHKEVIEIINQLEGSVKKQFKIVTEKEVLQYWENENDN